MEEKEIAESNPKSKCFARKKGRNKSVTEAKERIVKVNMLLHVGA